MSALQVHFFDWRRYDNRHEPAPDSVLVPLVDALVRGHDLALGLWDRDMAERPEILFALAQADRVTIYTHSIDEPPVFGLLEICAYDRSYRLLHFRLMDLPKSGPRWVMVNKAGPINEIDPHNPEWLAASAEFAQ